MNCFSQILVEENSRKKQAKQDLRITFIKIYGLGMTDHVCYKVDQNLF